MMAAIGKDIIRNMEMAAVAVGYLHMSTIPTVYPTSHMLDDVCIPITA